MKKAVGIIVLSATLLSACAPTAQTTSSRGSATPRAAFDAYNAALQANDVALLMTRVTDDIVWMPQQLAPIMGKKAAAEFVTGLFGLGKVGFDIRPVEEVVNGNWAYIRYDETLTLTDKTSGQVTRTWPSKGLIILHRGPDGTWLVARDSFSDNAK